MRHRLSPALGLLAALVAICPVQAAPSRQPPVHSSTTGPGTTLEAALGQIAAPSGIRFRIAPELTRDPIQARPAGTAWPDVVRDLLRGYNYAGTWDGQGRLIEVSVTGRNGDGTAPPAGTELLPAPELLSYPKSAPPVPARYQSYAPGSVHAIKVPIGKLRGMKKGERVSARLPDGLYSFIHDNTWKHEDGDETWVGYVDGPEGKYRALLTLGGDGVEGDIRTPGGLYQVETDGEEGWLVDINASGLQRASLMEDEHSPALFLTPPLIIDGPARASAAGRVTDKLSRTPPKNATVNAEGKPVIDLMVVYTSGMASRKLRTLVNDLVAHANQAMVDSQVNAVLRLVARRPVSYPNGGDNDMALDSLTYFTRGFESIPGLRRQVGADIVMLIRPFKPLTQGRYCGEAWVNGSGGDSLDANLAFGVVSHGAALGLYCSKFTLAHEIGHVLGATHDRLHADVPGIFEYSYGYGIEKQFGDIMSYDNPEVGVYANPNVLRCKGSPCGIPAGQPGSADVALTFNRTARTVSGFLKAVKKSLL